jgi:hypothetical protein
MGKYKISKKLSIEDKLGDFLKKEGLLEEVIKTTIEIGGLENIKDETELTSLSGCFVWKKSQRGHDFWEKIGQKFWKEN